MPRKLLRRLLPDHRRIRDHERLRVFGARLQDPDLWHLNRRSVAGATAVGLFMAWVPVPLQMVWAAGVAIWLRVNLPIAVVMVWVTNPVTMPPMYFFAYKLGAWLLGHPTRHVRFELSLQWVSTTLLDIWPSFLLGCLLLGLLSALAGSLTIRGLWRMHVVRSWQERKRRRQARRQGALTESGGEPINRRS